MPGRKFRFDAVRGLWSDLPVLSLLWFSGNSQMFLATIKVGPNRDFPRPSECRGHRHVLAFE